MTKKKHRASISDSRAFRVIRHPGDIDYVLEWQTLDGTIMTITSIRISRDGLLATADVLAEVAEKIMEAPVAS